MYPMRACGVCKVTFDQRRSLLRSSTYNSRRSSSDDSRDPSLRSGTAARLDDAHLEKRIEWTHCVKTKGGFKTRGSAGPGNGHATALGGRAGAWPAPGPFAQACG